MADYDLDLIFKEDQYCLTLTGKEFIFSSGHTFLEFIFKYGYKKRHKVIDTIIHNVKYVGFIDMDSKSGESFLMPYQENIDSKEERGSLVWAVNDVNFLRLVSMHLSNSDTINFDGLKTTASAWGRDV
jgi:hypothetical protein